MVIFTDLLISFWGYALEKAVFILNRAPMKAVEGTPFEKWHGHKPVLSFLQIRGCDAYVKCLVPTKLEPIYDKCTFIGYFKETRGYYFYKPSENMVFIARGGVFMEREFIYKDVSARTIHLEEIQDGVDPSEPLENHVEEPKIVVEQELVPATIPEGPR